MRPLCVLCSLLLSASAGATTLTFDTNPPPVVNNRVLLQEYGDRVVDEMTDALGTGAAAAGSYLVGAEGATPNVEVIHDSVGDPVLWTTGYGDLTNVSWRVESVTLQGDPGVLVIFESVDLACFGCSDLSVGPQLALLDGAGTELWSSGGNIVFNDGAGHETFAPLPEISANAVELVIDYTGTQVANPFVAIDNLRFRQVPAPSTLVLLAAAGLVSAHRGRRSTAVR